MKENQYDEVLSRTLERVDKIAERLSKSFKNVKPFAQEPIPMKELMQSYQALTPDDMNLLIVKYGQDKVGEFIRDMEKGNG